MKSPFPGMDPYLERRWGDVHSTLITCIREALQLILPRGLLARSEERILLEEGDEGSYRSYRSDVMVIRSPSRPEAGGQATAVIVPEPYLVEVQDFSPPVDRFVQIIDTSSGNRVITAIEVLSPGNKKRGRLNEDYLRKPDDYGRASVSVVEIDLLRSSRKHMSVNEEDLPASARQPYVVVVRRSWHPRRWEVFPISLRTPLPAIPIPLRKNDKDAILPLQPLIERVYVGGAHGDMDYSHPPDPPLSPEDAVWAAELVKGRGG